MVRFFFRFMSLIALALSVLFLVIDGSRSMAASGFIVTNLGTTWQTLLPGGPAATGAWLADRVHPFLNEPLLATLLVLPTSFVLCLFAVLFYVMGRAPRSAH